MNRATVIVSGLLAISVAMNVGFIARGREQGPESPGQTARKSQPVRVEAAEAEVFRSAPSGPATDRAPEFTSPSRLISESASLAASQFVLPSRFDPRVARLLEEEEEFRLFWHDLSRVFGIQEKLEPEEYNRVILTSTADFLRLQEPLRSQFFSQTRAALIERVQARKEYDDAKKTLPLKDKNNPVLYDTARKPLETNFQAKMKSSEARVESLLDLTQGRHQEFTGKLQKWLKELEPIAP